MKIRELEFFEEDIKQEFCTYLKQYFKENCKVECPGINSISAYITFEDDKNVPDNKVTVTVNNNCSIYLYDVNINVNLPEFLKYVNAFLDREYTPKKHIKEKDMRQIFAFYNKLKIAFDKDKIEAFYNAIQNAIFYENRYYLFNARITEADDKAEIMQEINLNGSVNFKITINTKAGIKCECIFSVTYAELYNELSALDIAKKLTQLQLKLERIL